MVLLVLSRQNGEWVIGCGMWTCTRSAGDLAANLVDLLCGSAKESDPTMIVNFTGDISVSGVVVKGGRSAPRSAICPFGPSGHGSVSIGKGGFRLPGA